MEERLCLNDKAEFALSSMVTMIMILLFSSIIAGMSIMIVEQAFMESKSQSFEQSETLNSVPIVLVFEVEEFDTTGNTNDRLYIMFKFPYAFKYNNGPISFIRLEVCFKFLHKYINNLLPSVFILILVCSFHVSL